MKSADRKILREEEIVIVLAVLVHSRKSRGGSEHDAAIDLVDVLHALRVSGYCLVPCGVLDAIKLQLTPYGTDADLEEILRSVGAWHDKKEKRRKK